MCRDHGDLQTITNSRGQKKKVCTIESLTLSIAGAKVSTDGNYNRM